MKSRLQTLLDAQQLNIKSGLFILAVLIFFLNFIPFPFYLGFEATKVGVGGDTKTTFCDSYFLGNFKQALFGFHYERIMFDHAKKRWPDFKNLI